MWKNSKFFVNFELLGSNEKHLYTSSLDQSPISGWINSIFCFNNFISYFESNFEPNFVKKSFMTICLEMGETIPFFVWMIPFPVLKIDSEELEQLRSISCFENWFWAP